MTATTLAPKSTHAATDPVVLHYVRRDSIDTDRPAVALCGEQSSGGATSKATSGGGATSYTCPDCMIRYMLLTGGGSNG